MGKSMKPNKTMRKVTDDELGFSSDELNLLNEGNVYERVDFFIHCTMVETNV